MRSRPPKSIIVGSGPVGPDRPRPVHHMKTMLFCVMDDVLIVEYEMASFRSASLAIGVNSMENYPTSYF